MRSFQHWTLCSLMAISMGTPSLVNAQNSTFIPSTGLSWRHFDETIGKSFNTVNSTLLQPGQRLEGWRYPCQAEIESLYDAVWPPWQYGSNTTNEGIVNAVGNILGFTTDLSNGFRTIEAISYPRRGAYTVSVYGLVNSDRYRPDNEDGVGIPHAFRTGNTSQHNRPIASYLVRGSSTDPVASYTTFGAGCAGSGGVPILEAAPGSLPRSDGTFTLQLSNLPAGNGIAVVFFGYSKTHWAGGSLPLDLGPFGMGGCALYVSPDQSVQVPTSGGTAQFALDIPCDPALLGVHFFNQGAVLDPGVNPLNLIVTNAAAGIVGR